MKKILGFLIVGCLVACGGSDPNDAFRSTASGDDSGEGGGEDGEAGGDSFSSAGGEDGEGGSTSTTSTSSGSCQPSVTCASVGAECGTISDDGCGNSIECPDNCSGVNTCGGAGDQFKCGCTPLTPDNFPESTCGSVSDGCGGTIEFSTDCGEDPYASCGGDFVDPESGEVVEGEENSCGGGCIWLNDPLKDQECVNFLGPASGMNDAWRCSELDVNRPPRPECVHFPDGSGFATWCCSEPR